MAEHDHVLARAPGRFGPVVDARDAIVERQHRLRADRTPHGQAHMADDDVGARLGHFARLLGLEDVGRGQQIEPVRSPDQVDLRPEAHAGLLQIGTKDAVDQPDAGKVLDAREAEAGQAMQEWSRIMKGSVPLTPASTGVWRTIGSTSWAMSTTTSLALP